MTDTDPASYLVEHLDTITFIICLLKSRVFIAFENYSLEVLSLLDYFTAPRVAKRVSASK